MTEWHFDPVGDYKLTLGVALALLILILAIRAAADRLSPGQRRVLLALRIAIGVLLILCLLRPALVHATLKRQTATLAILADGSRSMETQDSLGGKSRYQALQAALHDAAPTLAKLAKDFDVKMYEFDADLHPLDLQDGRPRLPTKPTGEQTAIGAALEELLRREASQRLIGVILLSDGAQRAYAPRAAAPQPPARRLAELGSPLYTFPFGQAREQGQARDIAIKEFLINPTVYVKNQLVATAVIRAEGFAKERLTAQLLFESADGKDAVVASKSFRPAREEEDTRVELSYAPDSPGEYRVTLRVEPQNGESSKANNELSTFVTVLTGGVKVLYVEGGPRVEQKFLARYSLDASTDIHVDYVELVNGDSKTRKANLREKFGRGQYDVYMLGDVDATTFTDAELKALADAVAHGAGLIMLGGYHTLGPGGYQKTPLADLLPVRMNDLDRQRLGDATRMDVHLPGPLTMRPAQPFGTRHFVMAISSAADNLATWLRLPPLEGANRLRADALKPGAQVLAETTKGEPLLVAQEAGGRVMVFAGDSTWHWWMEGFEEQHKRFWRQMILWLAQKDETPQGSVWAKLAQRRFAPNSRVEFTVGARTPHGEPATDAKLEVVIVGPDGARRNVHVSRHEDAWSGVFLDTQMAGDYVLEVSATHDGAPLGSAKTRFLVYAEDLELDNPAADPSLLASLAAITKSVGGESLAPEELTSLLERIRQKPPELEVEVERKDTYWDTWPFMLTFIGLMCLDWFLRKRWGLV